MRARFEVHSYDGVANPDSDAMADRSGALWL